MALVQMSETLQSTSIYPELNQGSGIMMDGGALWAADHIWVSRLNFWMVPSKVGCLPLGSLGFCSFYRILPSSEVTWLWKMDENAPLIDDLPIKMVIFNKQLSEDIPKSVHFRSCQSCH